jgi:hypothetical protein
LSGQFCCSKNRRLEEEGGGGGGGWRSNPSYLNRSTSCGSRCTCCEMAVWSILRPRRALLKFLAVVLALHFFVWVQQMGAGTSGEPEEENALNMRRLEPPDAVFAFDVLPSTRLNCARGAHSTPIVHCRFQTSSSRQSQTYHGRIHPGLIYP